MDNIRKIERAGRGIWSSEALRSLLGLSAAATSVFCSRAVDRGDLLRINRGVYVLPGWIARAEEREIFALSNLLQTPSYVSLATALSHLGATTQIVRSACEAVSSVRAVSYEVEGFVLGYHKLPRSLYFGFERQKGVFIARPEKALLDAAHLAALGRYSIDTSSIEWDRFDHARLAEDARRFPARTARFLARMEEAR